jgi:hypothetical protein
MGVPLPMLKVKQKTPNKNYVRETLIMNKKTPNNFIAREITEIDQKFIPYTLENFINSSQLIDYQI